MQVRVSIPEQRQESVDEFMTNVQRGCIDPSNVSSELRDEEASEDGHEEEEEHDEGDESGDENERNPYDKYWSGGFATRGGWWPWSVFEEVKASGHEVGRRSGTGW